MSNFTPEDLLLFYYNELPDDTSTVITEDTIANDWTLKEELKFIDSSINQLNSVDLVSPRTKAILNILDYAHKGMPETV